MPARYAFRLEDLRAFHLVRASCHACGRKAIERPGGLLVRELADGVGDPAPQGLAVVIVPRGEIVGARSRNSAPRAHGPGPR